MYELTYNQMVMVPEQLDLIFKALSDGTRRTILQRIGPDEVAVKDLADVFAISQPAVSKHLAVLERAGLIMRRRNGRNNLCRLNQEPVAAVERFLAKYKLFWQDRFEALDRHLTEDENDPNQS